MAIRNTAKGVVIHEGKILLNRGKIEGRECYALPGGGQHPYEDMKDAVVRECLEETGYRVIPGELMALYEEIRDNPELREKHPDYTHIVYHVFLCRLADEEMFAPVEMDSNQIGAEWIDLNALDGAPLCPSPFWAHMRVLLNNGIPKFLGTLHRP